MTECLFVVIGAGASYASTSPDNIGRGSIGTLQGLAEPTMRSQLAPPLVTELFEPRFAGILDKYPIAQMAASDIRTRTQSPVAIEDYLRERYRDSDDPLDQRKFHAVHWYLQDLLWTVSQHYTTHPDNYDRLLTGCLRLPRVVFITLNYDTLLDDRLRNVLAIDSLGGYTPPDENWGLVKLHGSVDWGIPIQGPALDGSQIVYNPPPKIHLRNEIQLRRPGAQSIDDVRLERNGSQFFYPAMSVPVGTRDEFSCPPEHVGYLRNLLARQDRLDVLMLGYSALDEEVLNLFKESGRPLRSLTVVNANEETAVAAYQRVQRVMGAPRRNYIYKRSFDQFVGSDDFDIYLRDV